MIEGYNVWCLSTTPHAFIPAIHSIPCLHAWLVGELTHPAPLSLPALLSSLSVPHCRHTLKLLPRRHLLFFKGVAQAPRALCFSLTKNSILPAHACACADRRKRLESVRTTAIP